eukprot:CAMPEP_0116128036 /NCGR_PEP_ID=MMETSP0329-20121206/7149_1 /TAXON_ID=697910 /ORGANISM="Pseudo-nitzschia arenysensis, Strain B593" /LENGTH=217 /DNA_ID=CAMNT_0003622155 /DNA_START=75 /DNA_END=728 /DNA_ORIENTATION=+
MSSTTIRLTKKRKEPTSSAQQKKSVSFLPSVLMYRTLHINDYTDEEIDNTWYNGEEMQTIVDNCVRIISSIDEENPANNTQCIRGLEFRAPSGSKRRATHRFCAFDAVLGEQDAQWEYGDNDSNKIRIRYRVYSKPSQAEAFRIGLEDAKQAMAVYREGETCSLLTSTTKKTPTIDCFNRTSSKLQPRMFLVTPQTPVKNVRSLSHLQYHSPVERAK